VAVSQSQVEMGSRVARMDQRRLAYTTSLSYVRIDGQLGAWRPDVQTRSREKEEDSGHEQPKT